MLSLKYRGRTAREKMVLLETTEVHQVVRGGSIHGNEGMKILVDGIRVSAEI